VKMKIKRKRDGGKWEVGRAFYEENIEKKPLKKKIHIYTKEFNQTPFTKHQNTNTLSMIEFLFFSLLALIILLFIFYSNYAL